VIVSSARAARVLDFDASDVVERIANVERIADVERQTSAGHRRERDKQQKCDRSLE
jgi:hypothetical protein